MTHTHDNLVTVDRILDSAEIHGLMDDQLYSRLMFSYVRIGELIADGFGDDAEGWRKEIEAIHEESGSRDYAEKQWRSGI